MWKQTWMHQGAEGDGWLGNTGQTKYKFYLGGIGSRVVTTINKNKIPYS